MIENITKEQFQKVMDTYMIKDSSIGVHAINHENREEKANSILNNGLNNSSYHSGLTGTIEFLDTEDSGLVNDIFNYSYTGPDPNGNRYVIICAIPEIIESKEGVSYYLGKYTSFPTYGKDDYKSHSFPTHNLEILPSEFIFGCLIYNSFKSEYNFKLNSKYIGLQSDDKRREFNSNFLKKLFAIHSEVLTFDEEEYEKSKEFIERCGVKSDMTYYAKLFIKKYEELNNNRNR